jgi:glycosyltransferase involved in cell wall biosynthesis
VLACALLQQRGLPFTCDIVGYGEQADALQALIQAQGLDGHVRLLGKLAREQVLERYAAATVYVQPSRIAADGDRDGIPNVLLEALACALPVVATDVSGIPELVRHDHNGLLVPPDSPEALADAIASLIASPARAADLGRAGRATVTEHFDNDRNLQTLLRLLENAHAPAHACAAH